MSVTAVIVLAQVKWTWSLVEVGELKRQNAKFSALCTPFPFFCHSSLPSFPDPTRESGEPQWDLWVQP